MNIWSWLFWDIQAFHWLGLFFTLQYFEYMKSVYFEYMKSVCKFNLLLLMWFPKEQCLQKISHFFCGQATVFIHRLKKLLNSYVAGNHLEGLVAGHSNVTKGDNFLKFLKPWTVGEGEEFKYMQCFIIMGWFHMRTLSYMEFMKLLH